ncbi:P-loop containing nucleoside triphosphate hydrolase protein [Blyttiomyces helicus]|uniref:P-loop containing nucleoside triphosphate hydrolase protein n=1 Tax=Blyttiomyces helicus TaxID=388810 RepID=A0A4P9WGD7_9FUNG|nr:P-loop containing nucleoside triphosphate hydrolase protein [Blyttiomyces helicus]|eukprot:RKO91764.1 P-loop containing nucleoside triphosphate hydrolase protein [Blyttiomyces helicus]
MCLRRNKTAMLDGRPIIEIPSRTVHTDSKTFSAPEREFYDALERQVQFEFNEYIRASTVMNYSNVLVLLLGLRQACNHTSLVLRPADEEDEGKGLAHPETFQKPQDLSGTGWISSTKVERMMIVLEETQNKAPGDMTICAMGRGLIFVPLPVFCQFLGMLNLCEETIRHRGFKFEQGLDLTCANHVILLDPWWNPAVENQASDRIHRYGQFKRRSREGPVKLKKGPAARLIFDGLRSLFNCHETEDD